MRCRGIYYPDTGWGFEGYEEHNTGEVGRLKERRLKVGIGVSLQNIGTKLKYEKEGGQPQGLPLLFRVGTAIKLEETEFMAAVNKDKGGVKIGLGVEYYPLSYLALRAGYKTGYDNQGLSLGFGIIHKNIGFDYAYCPIKDLDSNHRVSMGIRF